MKKFNFLILLAIGLLAGSQSFAQLAIDKGTKFVNVGVGIGGIGYFGLGAGLGINAAVDFGVARNITVGAAAGYRGYGTGIGAFDIGPRGSYHFNELLKTPETVDLYAGLGLVYYGYTGLNGSTGLTNFYLPIHLGGRYMFSEKTGGFAELGSAVSTLRLGLTLKL